MGAVPPGSESSAWGVSEQASPAAVTSASTCQNQAAGYQPSTMTCVGFSPFAAKGPDTTSAAAGDPLIDTETNAVVGVSPGPSASFTGSENAFVNVSAFYGPLAEQFDASTYQVGAGGGVLLAENDPVIDDFLWWYTSNSSGGLDARENFGVPETPHSEDITLYTQFDAMRSGLTGTLARTTSGQLVDTYWNLANFTWPNLVVGRGWNIYDKIVGVGDVGGAAAPDMVARDKAGVLWLYLGEGNGRFAARSRIGGGWNTYNAIVGDGDITGDGYADLITRDSAGRLWLYQGTGNWRAPFRARVQLGHGFQTYNQLAVVNDYAGAGKSALVGRDGAGVLWVYRSTGTVGASMLAARKEIGGGWNIYSELF